MKINYTYQNFTRSLYGCD